MSDGVKIKVLVQVEDNEPNCIGEGLINPHNVQQELEKVFMALVKYLRVNPLGAVGDVVD